MENEVPKETAEEVKTEEVKEEEVKEGVEKKDVEVAPTPEAKSFVMRLKENWKILTPIVVVVLVALGAWWGRGLFLAAIVDGEPISRLAVIRELEKRSGGQALDTMVIKKIILKQALEEGITISNDDVEAELSMLRERMGGQGGTLEDALEAQGLTLDQFKEQIILQKALEKILKDRVAVTDDEINNYLETTKATKPASMSEEDFRGRVREQLEGQKFGVEAEQWLIEEKQKANIRYFVDYALPLPGEEVSEDTTSGEEVPASIEAK